MLGRLRQASAKMSEYNKPIDYSKDSFILIERERPGCAVLNSFQSICNRIIEEWCATTEMPTEIFYIVDGGSYSEQWELPRH